MELFATAKKEVDKLHLNKEEQIIAWFASHSKITGDHERISLLQNEQEDWICLSRKWETTHDIPIWNRNELENFQIEEKRRSLTVKERKILSKILNELTSTELPCSIQLEKENAIVIHSNLWEMGFYQKETLHTYKWVAASEDIELFVPLIDFLKDYPFTEA